MAIDAYIKFGEGTDLGPDNKPLPKIEGDSDDEAHYWWCELRGCDFEMEASERSEEEADTKEEKKSKAELKPITIKKRVDWASCELFTKCCEAAEATTKKADDDDQEKGRIKQVTVEVCRQSGEKFPFLTIKYTGVTVVKYGIDMSGPEPTETITFKAEMTQFEYQRTDADTGEKKGGPVRTGELASYTPQAQGAGGATGAAAAAAAAAEAADAAPGGPDGNGALDGMTATEAGVNANFPGLANPTGFGLLPD